MAIPKLPSKNAMRFLIAGLILTMVFYVYNRRLFFLLLFVVIGCFLKYKRAMMRIPVSAEPVFFLSILLTRIYGLQYSLVLIIISVFLIDLLAGDITINSIISFLVQFSLNLAAIPFAGMDLLFFGILVSIANMIISMVLSAMWGVPPDRMILMPLTGFLINVAYFMTFGELLQMVMT